MQTFQKPQQLNGAQLIDELLSVGINLDNLQIILYGHFAH